MSASRPTAREIFKKELPIESDRDRYEREFFARVMLPNRTVKTTCSHRLDDVNDAAFRYIESLSERPLQIMDVAISSGVSSAEWYEHLESRHIDFALTATDLVLYCSLVTIFPGIEAVVDKDQNILHFDLFGRGMPPRASGLPGLITQSATILFRIATVLGITQNEPLELLSRKLGKYTGVCTMEDDLLANNPPNFIGRFHVIRAANILNLAYFSEQTILRIAGILTERLKHGGLLIVCKTDEGINHGSIFRMSGSVLHMIFRIGAGSEIEQLIQQGDLAANARCS